VNGTSTSSVVVPCQAWGSAPVSRVGLVWSSDLSRIIKLPHARLHSKLFKETSSRHCGHTTSEQAQAKIMCSRRIKCLLKKSCSGRLLVRLGICDRIKVHRNNFHCRSNWSRKLQSIDSVDLLPQLLSEINHRFFCLWGRKLYGCCAWRWGGLGCPARMHCNTTARKYYHSHPISDENCRELHVFCKVRDDKRAA
jgi:hypothetical protein